MKSCGSTLIDSLAYRASYALIGVKNGAALDEKTFEDGGANAVATAVHSNTQTNTITVNSTSRRGLLYPSRDEHHLVDL